MRRSWWPNAQVLEALFPPAHRPRAWPRAGDRPSTSYALRLRHGFGGDDDFLQRFQDYPFRKQGLSGKPLPFAPSFMPEDVALPPIWLLDRAATSRNSRATGSAPGFSFAYHFAVTILSIAMLTTGDHFSNASAARDQPYRCLRPAPPPPPWFCADTMPKRSGLASPSTQFRRTPARRISALRFPEGASPIPTPRLTQPIARTLARLFVARRLLWLERLCPIIEATKADGVWSQP